MALKDHLNKLEYFCAIAENRSILRASFSIGITQPQLSRVVKQLEEELAKELLIRKPSGIQLTKDGQELYQSASSIIQQINETERLIKFGKSILEGNIHVGAYDSIARYFFPSFLKYLKKTQPKLNIHLETDRSAQIFEKLKKKELDIGVCVDHVNFKSKTIKKQIIYSDSFGFYYSPGISPQFLEQLIIFPDSIELHRGELKSFLKKYKFRSITFSNNLETVKSLCEEGIGVGLLPHRVAREAIFQGKLMSYRKISLTKSLSPHDIILCRNMSTNKIALTSIELELIHFLTSWSKN